MFILDMYMFHAYLGPMRYVNMHEDLSHIIYAKGEVCLNIHFYAFPYKKEYFDHSDYSDIHWISEHV
jgi:hypothetical protein